MGLLGWDGMRIWNYGNTVLEAEEGIKPEKRLTQNRRKKDETTEQYLTLTLSLHDCWFVQYLHFSNYISSAFLTIRKSFRIRSDIILQLFSVVFGYITMKFHWMYKTNVIIVIFPN